MFWFLSIFLVLLGSTNVVLSSVPPPGKVLDFSTFKDLQVPVDDGKGGMTEIKHPELDTYSSKYMYTDEWDTSKVVFWAPINGVISGHGAGPRTELTEPNNLFTFSGKHTMKFTQQVKQIPSCGDVCIGQIKGDSYNSQFFTAGNGTVGTTGGDSCLIVVELTFDGKNAIAHTRDKNCQGVKHNLGSYTMDEEIHISMTVDGYYVYVSSNKVNLGKIDYSFWKGANYGMHFKVGIYDQCSGKSSEDGGKTKLSGLQITHSN